MTQEHEIEGWKIRLLAPMGNRTKFHVEAKDPMWGKYAESCGPTAIEALEGLAIKTGLDRQELIETFA